MPKLSDFLPLPPWKGLPVPRGWFDKKNPKAVVTGLAGHISAYIPSERASADLSEIEPEMVPELGLPPGKWYWFNRIINQSGKPHLGSLLLDEVLSYCKDKNYRILNQVQPYGKLTRSELERWYLSRGFVPLDYKKYGYSLLVWPE